MDTRTVVEKYFIYVNSGRWDDYLTLFDDNIVMDEQVGGHLEGIDALRKAIEPLRTNPDFRNYPEVIVVEGDRAMVQWHEINKNARGETVELRGVNYFEVIRGRITYFANFHDTAASR